MTNLASKKTISIPFAKLALADENLRSSDAADPFVPNLAETLINEEGKSLQILPLFVKPQSGGIHEILDGRRRWMAYNLLINQGRIPESFQLRAVVCETEAEIAQAVIIANTERLATSEADELITLNKLVSDKFTVADMARALGRAEKDIRQKLVLAKVDAAFLTAYKEKNITYKALRNIARLKDEGFIEDLKSRLESRGSLNEHETVRHDNSLTENSSIFRVISIESYLAAGGRIENDLLEELPGKILDTDIALNVFDEALKPSKDFMQSVGIEGYGFERPEYQVMRDLPWNFKSETSDEDLAALHKSLFGQSEDEAEDEYMAEEDDYEEGYDDDDYEGEDAGADEPAPATDVPEPEAKVLTEAERIAAFNDSLIKHIKFQIAKGAPLNPRYIYLQLSRLNFEVFYSADEIRAHYEEIRIREAAERGEEIETGNTDSNTSNPYRPVVKLPPVDTKGFSNAHHERTTRMCGQGLSVSLRTNPIVSLALQIATQFRPALREVTNYYDGCENVLTLRAQIAITGSKKDDPKLTGPLLEELKSWKDRFIESEKTYLAFVLDLPLNEMLELFSILTALQVDLTEIRTDFQSAARRRQAVEVAEVLGHRFEQIMIPDVDYFRGFKKPALIGFIKAMGVDATEFEKLKTGPLQEAVAELAQEHRFVPEHLNPMVGTLPPEEEEVDAGAAEDGDVTDEDTSPETTEESSASEGDEIAA
jgi:ParB family chromosome partitioning protein